MLLTKEEAKKRREEFDNTKDDNVDIDDLPMEDFREACILITNDMTRNLMDRITNPAQADYIYKFVREFLRLHNPESDI